MVELLSLVILGFAVVTLVVFLCNLAVFRRAPVVDDTARLPAVSVLIPARDEEHGIRQTLDTLLAQQNVELEVVVLDDQSQDATAREVAEVAAGDSRVRLLHGRPLPLGWCGKQYACHQLAQQAKNSELLFIDADVKLAPDAVARCVQHRLDGGTNLLSGFPRQVVGGLGEALMTPLIHIVLLTYLPFWMMRKGRMPSASAGCGQLFATSRAAYERSGGHAAIKSSLHDGVTLPRAYRRAGLTTDVFDASDLARCRMYSGWSQTFRGLLKNAHEGIANRHLIVPATSLMVMGYLAPTILALYQLFHPTSVRTVSIALTAAVVSYVPRVVTAARFDRTWLSAGLFPLSILLFVTLQWVAFVRHSLGSPSTWRGRTYTPTTA
jgi:glycosyltransferase involved in cell wall biosynthesis